MPARSMWILLLAALLGLRPVDLRAEARTAKHVLLVYSHERELAMYAGLDRSLRAGVKSGAADPVEFYTEYLDLIRFAEPGHQYESVDYLRLKYSSLNIDLIVVVSSLAFDFILEHGEEVFGDVPVVFTSVNVSRIETVRLKPNMTGVAVKRDFSRTLDLALRVQPDTRQVVIPVGSSPTEKAWADAARETLRPYERRVGIAYLSDLSIDAMLDRVQKLPPHTLVMFTPLFYFDGNGRYFLPEEALTLMAARSSAPIYGTDEAYLGNGIVGGVLFDPTSSGGAAGRLAQRVLAGEQPASIPVEIIDPNYATFDARQLERWGISESRLPAGSVIRFAEISVWTRYKVYIVGAVSLLVLQTALIAGLMANRMKRRRAESSLRASHARVRDLAGRLITAQEAERTRIARELHDDVGQRIASFSIAISAIKRRLADAPAAVHDDLTSLQTATIALSQDLRLLSHELHPGLLEHLGLVDALKARCEEVRAESGINVGLDVAPGLGPMPDATALCLYRVAQEALHNVVKHAHATTARIRLARQNGHIAMSVTDDGRGFESGTAAGHRGLGLVSLDERVRMLDGVFAIETSSHAGTTVSVTIPARGDA